MSGKENKRSRSRRTHSNHLKMTSNSATSSVPSSFSQLLSLEKNTPKMSCEVPTDFSFRPTHEDTEAEKITELMDAPLDFDIPVHAISKGPNPYLNRCMYCNTPRTTQEGEDDGTEFLDFQLDGNRFYAGQNNTQSFSSVKLEIWTCPTCLKVAGSFQSFLEANLPQVAAATETVLPEQVSCINSLCSEYEEESSSDTREGNLEETEEIQNYWAELRTIVKDLHATSDEISLLQEQGDRLQSLIHRLCEKGPHQLFLCLESQMREMITDIKSGLLEKLNDNGVHNPELALDFTSTLLHHYDQVTKKAHYLAQYLGGLTEHLRQFQVTWELLNKHLFHSIAHNDPAISSVGPTILEQLRQGSLQYERSMDDPYCSVRKRLLKFQEEMSVVVVVWRDCQQLIENFCQEEFKNTQKQVTNRAKSFITQQRQLLKNHLMKDSFMDEETMKSLVSGHKSSKEKVLCHRCKRERCTCDECTITHMITCGIINTEKGTTMPPPPSSFNFALDHAQNVMDITPPSMSSTTSSSGSVSPINVEDKLSAYYDCDKVLTEELREAMLSCDSKDRRLQGLTLDDLIDNIDGNTGDDEDEDLDDAEHCVDHQNGCDEPHSLQLPLWDGLEAHHLLHNNDGSNHAPHSCAQCHQFQPRIDSDLSKQLEAEIANSGVPITAMNDYVSSTVLGSSNGFADNQSSSNGNLLNPNICASCQCHACLKQSGHVISTSLPLQVPVSPPPAELNLYPHIHGLPTPHYMFGLPSPIKLPSPLKLPFKVDFDETASIQDHLYAYSDWDNPRPGSLAAQHQHQVHPRLSGLTSELLPPAPVVDAVTPFAFEALSLNTASTQTLTNSSSVFKSVHGKTSENFVSPVTCNTEGSSVDPATKPLDFSSFLKIPHACMNSTSSSLPLFTSSVPSTIPSSVVSSVPMTTTTSSLRTVNRSCHGPPSSRPIPLGGNAAVASSKWEKSHSLQQCKKLSTGTNKLGLVNQQGEPINPFSGANIQALANQVPHSSAVPKNIFTNQFVKSSGRHAVPCPHTSCSNTKVNDAQTLSSLNHAHAHAHVHASDPSSISTSTPSSSCPASSPSSSPSSSSSSSSSLATACSNHQNGHHLPSNTVNNIPSCTTLQCADSDCKVHHEDNCDSIDDSCSERSSSTSSNQKEGKYCDCCYCEFFGHNNPQGAKTSPNYHEMKDRLRKKLKKKNETKQPSGAVEAPKPEEKQGVDELVKYINGTDEGSRNKTTSKAAKRARQKQRKLEEKARVGMSSQKARESNVRHQPIEETQSLSSLLLKAQHCKASNLKCENASRSHPSEKSSDRMEEFHKKLAIFKEEMQHQESSTSSVIVEATKSTLSLGQNGKSLGHVLNMLHQTIKNNSPSIQANATKSQPTLLMPPNSSSSTNPASSSPTISNNVNNLDKKMNGSVIKITNSKKSLSAKVEQQAKQQPLKSTDNQSSSVSSKLSKSQNSEPTPSVTSNNHTKSPLALNSVENSKPPTKYPPTLNKTSTGNNSSTSSPKTASVIVDSKQTGNGEILSKKGSSVALPVTRNVPSSAARVTPSSATPSSSLNKTSAPSSSAKNGNSVPPKSEGVKVANGKSKKNKKKNKSDGGDDHDPEEVFMPKSQEELESTDPIEWEVEQFKRFCYDSSKSVEPKKKLMVNVNLKDVFKKKSTLGV